MSQLVVQYSFDEDGLLSRVTAANGGGENWEEKIIRDSEGLKIEKIFSGGIRMTRTYDAYGNVISQKSRSLRQDGYDRRYAWNASGRLQSVIDGITGGRTSYAYDAVGSLMSARSEDGTDDYRMPDTVGNVFRSRDRRDREYGKGGRILHDRHYDYLYDVEGNLILKTPRRGLTQHRTTRCRRKVARILHGRQVTMPMNGMVTVCSRRCGFHTARQSASSMMPLGVARQSFSMVTSSVTFGTAT